MSIAEVEKIIGQSLNGRKSIRKPVNNDRIAIANNTPITDRDRFLFNLLSVFSFAKITIKMPRKISVRPSTSHSIVMINLLSSEISPKFFTTLEVGIT